MKKLVLIGIYFVFGMMVGRNAAAVSLREQFVSMKNVDSVWAIDKYCTVLLPSTSAGAISDAFVDEFLVLSRQFGPIEIEISITDKLTERKQKKWVGVEVSDRKKKFIDPATGYEEYFLVHPEYNLKIGNEFIINNYLYDSRKDGSGTSQNFITKIIVTHTSPQPIVYKSEMVEKTSLSIPPEGDFSLKPFSRGFMKGFQYGDVVQYMVLLAEKWGRGIFIVNSVEGYKEVAPSDFYVYLETTPSTQANILFFCDNPPKPFVIKAKNGSYQVFHRTLEGINYKPLSGSMAAAGAAAAAAPKPQSIPESLAMEAITNKSDFESNPKPSEQYKVLYHGVINGCETVTVQRSFSTSGAAPAQPIETFDYVYCSGQLNQLPVEFVSQLPGDVDRLVPQVAHKAQQEGQARASYTNYNVSGRALRDRAECRVQIRIFKGQKFLEERIVNGCEGK